MTMRQRIATLIQAGHLSPEVWVPVLREPDPVLDWPVPRSPECSVGCREWFETYGEDGRVARGSPY